MSPTRMAFLSTAMLATLFSPALSETGSFSIGDMTVAYNPAQWRPVGSSADEVVLEPQGTLAGRQHPLRFFRHRGSRDSTCRAVAKTTWASQVYGAFDVSTDTLGGLPAAIITVATRCRNATPTGRIACMEYSGSIYGVLAMNAIASCREEMPVLFPDPRPLDELLGSIRFAP